MTRCAWLLLLGVAGGWSSAGAAGVGPAVPPFGLGAFDRREPISITADQLDAQDTKGKRTLAFRRNVEVRQASLSMRAQLLRATYAAGDREPRRLEARGDVRIQEGERRARCREAIYDRPAQRIVCRGEPARLWDGNDQLAGREVIFDLADQSVAVVGETRVEIHRDLDAALQRRGESPAESEPAASGSLDEGRLLEELRGGGPVRIQAAELVASDTQGARRILFRGDVVLRQGEIELRSGELEASYPPESRQPDSLLARDEVVIIQGEREARCERAEYRVEERLITCEGDARLRDAEDRLAGRHIALDLAARRVDVVGDARLWVDPEARDARRGAEAAASAEPRP